MTNIYFLRQCQYISKRKGYENILKGSLQEKLALIFNQIFLWSLGRKKNGTFLGVCLKVDFHCRVIFTCVRTLILRA